MNKILLSALTVASMMTAACSSDDDTPVNYANEVAGSYEGYTNASCGFFSDMIADNQKVVVTAGGEKSVTVKFDSDTWGSTTITDAAVTPADNGYIITGTGTCVIASHSGDGTTKSYECSVEGKVDKAGSKAVFTFSIPDVMNGLTIVFNQGEAPAALIVAGSYKGYSDATTGFFDGMISEDESVVITAAADGKVNIAYSSPSWGDATFNGATVTRDGDRFTIAGDGVLRRMSGMGGNGEMKDYDCSLNGTVTAGGDAEIVLTVPDIMMGSTITFITGEAPASE